MGTMLAKLSYLQGTIALSDNRYNRATYLLSAHKLEQCPADTGMEIAFAGSSNVGKSSVINAITGNHKLARTSKIPGRTQQLNFFVLDDGLRFVDLPGYGYAKVPEKVRQHWGRVLQAYFEERQSLVGLFLIMDVRHPLKPFDIQMLEWCNASVLPVHILLNKSDKVSRGAAQKSLQLLKRDYPGEKITAQLFSVTGKTGFEEARDKLDDWFSGHIST